MVSARRLCGLTVPLPLLMIRLSTGSAALTGLTLAARMLAAAEEAGTAAALDEGTGSTAAITALTDLTGCAAATTVTND